MFKKLLFLFLLFAVQHACYGQKLALVNNTSCNIRFNLGGAINNPCGETVYVGGIVPERTTIRWPGPEAVDWNRKAEQVYWKNFAVDATGAILIGDCNDDVLFSPVIFLQDCDADIEYQWKHDPATGNIEIVINHVSLSIPATLSRTMKLSRPKGGTTIIIKPMLDVETSGNKLYVRTNKIFIADIRVTGNAFSNTKLQSLTPATHYEACRVVSLSPSAQQVFFNCFCGMEQVFYLYKGDEYAISISTVTEL